MAKSHQLGVTHAWFNTWCKLLEDVQLQPKTAEDKVIIAGGEDEAARESSKMKMEPKIIARDEDEDVRGSSESKAKLEAGEDEDIRSSSEWTTHLPKMKTSKDHRRWRQGNKIEDEN